MFSGSNCALLFPGQGSQFVSMGKDFFDNFTIAKETFQEVDDYLGRSLSSIIFEGTAEELRSTTNAQVALLLVSTALLRVLQSELGLCVSSCRFVIGHSLGEYSALVAAEAFKFQDAIAVLDARAKAMNSCLTGGIGGMIAVLGLDVGLVEKLCFNSIKIANDNCPMQVVVSGLLKDFESFENRLRENNCRRSVRLDVSGPFHSEFMSGARESVAAALSGIDKKDPVIPVVSNVTAIAETDINVISDLLVEQVTSRIRFRESVEYMARSGIENAIEIGAGKVLSGLVRRTSPAINVLNVSSVGDIDVLVKSGIF